MKKPRPEALVSNMTSWREVTEHEKVCTVFQYSVVINRYRCKCGWVSRPWMTVEHI